jgi:hypothetical protein
MTPAAAHIVPFAAWIGILWLLDTPRIDPAWAYAFRVAVGAILLLVCRPWRWYGRPAVRHLPLALAAGLAVWVAWVFFESAWCPGGLRELYEKWAVMPFGKLREAQTSRPFDPAVCGWPLTLVRLAGSAFIISIAEEFFWRGFLYRWTFGGDFLRVDAGRLDWGRFLGIAAVFAVEHDEWLAGFFAGLVYAWMYLRTRDIWAACLAHAVTNLALGLYVLKAGAWQFW